MKPYFLVGWNALRFFALRAFYPQCRISPIEMLGYNTKLSMKKTSSITFGKKLISDGRMTIIVDGQAKLTIGDYVYFNEGAMISCKSSVSIGDNCKFGPNVKVFDNNHKFCAANGVSNAHSVGMIEIGKNCWIGANAVILKGAKIGDNCVIGAGCVIDCEIPSATIVTQGRDLTIKAMR